MPRQGAKRIPLAAIKGKIFKPFFEGSATYLRQQSPGEPGRKPGVSVVPFFILCHGGRDAAYCEITISDMLPTLMVFTLKNGTPSGTT